MTKTADPFFEPYDREQVAYGDQPSAALAAYLAQIDSHRGAVLDLGAGAGRDTIALAKAGFDVTAVDLSDRGLARIRQRAEASGLTDAITTVAADVREVEMPRGRFAGIVATTVLDHLPPGDAEIVWRKMTAAINGSGFLYVQVHTTEDPGCDREPGRSSTAPISETADAVINYFEPNQLALWACDPRSRLRILRYEERLEWDYTHGPDHLHGKAVLLAVRSGHHPPWYGQPPAFPKKVSGTVSAP